MRTRKQAIGAPGWLTVIVGLFVVLALLPWVVLAALAALGAWLQVHGYIVLALSVFGKPWRGHERRWITAMAFAFCLIGIAIWGELSGLSLVWLVSVAIVAGIFIAHSQGFAWPKEAKRHMDGQRTSHYTSYANEDSAMGDIDAMNRRAFETRTWQHFQAQGWRVWKPLGTGGDTEPTWCSRRLTRVAS